ncbi:hypothetical protein QVD17_14825 [Tagetes erecta]|uniref:Uncharacterized protein n=1 Tax=Tagetes erecta TaxID=13708 RepID=A0AAD8KS43_TARER|nr:hypothetical protein QVD17_14825 [Tagetes erecta]
MESYYSSCRGCGSPLHTRDDCPEFRKECEEARRLNELDAYLDDMEDYYSDLDKYYRDNTDRYTEQDRNYNSYDPRITKNSSYQMEYNDYYNEYFQPPDHEYREPTYEDDQVHYQDYYHAQSYGQENNNFSNQQPPLNHQSHLFEGLDKVMRERHMAYVEQELAKPHLSMEYRLELLDWKYDLLIKEVKDKRVGRSMLEQRQAKQRWLSLQIEEVVVENHSPLVHTTVGETKEEPITGDEEENDTNLPELEDEFLKHNDELVSYEDASFLVDEESGVEEVIAIEEAKEEERSKIKIRKVTWQDLGQLFMKWLHNNFLVCMSIIQMQLWNRHVNYRAFAGNSIGKCALRPP